MPSSNRETRMRRAARLSSREGEEGSTLLEVLVAMVVLSALGVGVWAAVTVSMQSVTRSRAGGLAATQVLQIDDRLRACVDRVRAPWWMPTPSIEAGEGSWRVPFLDGDPAKALVVSWAAQVLTIDDGSTASRYGGFTSARLAPALGADGKPFGVELSLEGKPIGKVSVVARYGGMELRAGGSP